jgi:hypothetical protein
MKNIMFQFILVLFLLNFYSKTINRKIAAMIILVILVTPITAKILVIYFILKMFLLQNYTKSYYILLKIYYILMLMILKVM